MTLIPAKCACLPCGALANMISKLCQLFNSERASVCQIRLSLYPRRQECQNPECQNNRHGGLVWIHAGSTETLSFSLEHKCISSTCCPAVCSDQYPFHAVGQWSVLEHPSEVGYAPACNLGASHAALWSQEPATFSHVGTARTCVAGQLTVLEQYFLRVLKSNW